MLKLEVPGIEEKDLDVRVENHTLTVKGERKFEAEEKEAELPSHRAALWQLLSAPSRCLRPWTRRMLAASYNAGVLKLELKKKPEAQPKQIKINVDGAKKVEAGIESAKSSDCWPGVAV